MNIKVHKTIDPMIIDSGGGYAVTEVEVFIDETATPKEQRMIAVHEVIEAFQPALPHGKVIDLTVLIMDAIEQLEK